MNKKPGFIVPLILATLAIIGMIAFTVVVVKANTEREGRPFDACEIIPSACKPK